MDTWSINRRTVMKAILLGSVAPWVGSSAALAGSCSDNIIRLAGVVVPDTMNPFASWANFWPLVFNYDWLVSIDAQRHTDRKGFAKEWSVADDNVTWTFKIWPGLKWSDGKPATARDAAFTYNFLRESMGTPNELNIGWNNTSGLENVESITALDDETLQIVTKSPTRWPVDHSTWIVPEHIWKDVSHADARGTFRNDPPLVGTGPMIVTEFKQGQFIRLAPNEFFREGKPATAGMIINIFDVPDPVVQGLKNGSFDYGYGLIAAQWDDLSKNPEIQVGQTRVEQRNYLAFNTAAGDGAGSSKALQDPAFRDAIGYAIDQKALVDRAFRGLADPGVGLAMPIAADYYSDLSDIRRHFDLAEAGRRLDAAGYRDTDGDGVREDKEGKRFQLELITSGGAPNIEIPTAAVQLIAGWLGQVGIPVSVTRIDPGALTARLATAANGGGGWDLLVHCDWPAPTAKDLLRLGNSKLVGTQNDSYWANEEFDRLVTEVSVTIDLKKSQELFDKAMRLIYTEAPYVVLCYPFLLDAHRKDCFKGWGTEDMMSQWSYFPINRLSPA
ncbi:ABC transporter substrate-binding protein [Ensifer aridi]|uniref:ABC transporter substrate-binding protein n=1 Tax=Ensifer aridi TaxID=1708715 RepID=UPI00358DDFA1